MKPLEFRQFMFEEASRPDLSINARKTCHWLFRACVNDTLPADIAGNIGLIDKDSWHQAMGDFFFNEQC